MKVWGKYLPYVAVATLLYFIGAVVWLLSQNTALIPAVLISLAVFVAMSGLLFFVLPLLRRVEQSPNRSGIAKLLFGASEKVSEPPASDSDGEESESAQEAFRRNARIEALQREDRKMHDKIFRSGAVISVALVIFGAIMYFAFGLSPKEVFFLPLAAVAVLWFLQIVFLPKSATYLSFLVFTGLRFAFQTFGPNILMMLPNFIMLPFFYLLMMFFMFGSIMLPNLAQIKYFKPGDGNWEVPKGSTRGQFIARAMVETQIDRFVRYAKGLSDRKPTRGMVFEGPPGTGKTLLAKEIATTLDLPVVIGDASAFNAPFMGFGQLIPLIVRYRTEGLAREYGGAIVFIDEGETLFGARSGMQQPTPFNREVDLWDVLDINGCQVFDVPHVRTRQWNEQQMVLAAQPAPPTDGKHGIFMMPGAGGGSSAIYPFLTWMSGTDSAPFMEKFLRRKANELFSAFFIPVKALGKVLRLPPGKPQQTNVMFITATNRFFMFDPAMIRPGRFGIVANFVNPDEDERADIFQHYLNKWRKMGYYQDDLTRPERIREFAQATPNTSPAEIEQMVEEAVDVRVQHVAELRRLKRYEAEGKIDGLIERDRKFWLRFKNTVYDAQGAEIKGWDDERVDWQALMETRSVISFGRANPEAAHEKTRRNVAFHEFGHFLGLKAFNGRRLKPTILTVVPRRGNLGMVAHVPHDTREQHPQEYYEGMVRTSIASWVTERFFFGQNMPGVSGDLRNATNTAALMVGKFGMPNYACSPADQKYYAGIGRVLISEPETSMFNPQATALLDGVLKNPSGREKVATIIGMAAIDAYRLIRGNEELFLEVIPEFLKLDEFSGGRLDGLWKKMDEELVTLDRMAKRDQRARPKRAFAAVNSFYGETGAEGSATYQKVVAQIEGGPS
ncbi:MAG: AAA family ATPase [Patescibacteria group bacterium]